MKFTCSKKDLQAALTAALRALPLKCNSPVLGGFCVIAYNNRVEVQTTDFNIAIRVQIPAVVEDTGKFVAPGKSLIDIAAKSPNDSITFSDSKENLVTVSSDNISFNLLIIDAADFPLAKIDDCIFNFRIDAAAFKALIRKSVFAAIKTETQRPALEGCLFEFDKSTLTVAATDARRLIVIKHNLSEPVDNFSFIIPAKTLDKIAALFKGNSAVNISCSKKVVAFDFDNIFITARLIDSTFPPYRSVIPSDFETRATLPAATLAAALDRISIIANDDIYNTVRIE